MQADTHPAALRGVCVEECGSHSVPSVQSGKQKCISVWRMYSLCHRKSRSSYVVFLHNNKYLCSVWLIDILHAAYICFFVHFTIPVPVLSWSYYRPSRDILFTCFPSSLFISFRINLFPPLLSSRLPFCFLSAFFFSSVFYFLLQFIYKDDISTALHIRWRKMLGWLWIN